MRRSPRDSRLSQLLSHAVGPPKRFHRPEDLLTHLGTGSGQCKAWWEH